MNVLKRGFLSIIRRPGKSLILFAAVFILGNLIAGAISITRAVDNMENMVRSQLSPAVMIEMNRAGDPIDSMLSEEAINKIGGLPQVDYYNYTIDVPVISGSLIKPHSEEMSPNGFEEYELRGVSNKNIIDAIQGNIKITDGRAFNENEMNELSWSALVSRAMASANDLQIGSEIKLAPLDLFTEGELYEYGYEAENEQEFVIIGIYDVTDSRDSTREGSIYVSNTAAKEFRRQLGTKEEDMYYETLFVLKDTDMMEDFKAEAEPLVPTGYIFADSGLSYDAVSSPMDTLKWVTNLILWIAAIASVLIVGFLTALFLHDRRHEMGIYLAMGERKGKLGVQILAEVLIVAVLAMALSLFTGSAVSDGVGRSMVKNYTETQTGETAETTVFEILGYADEVTSEDLAENFNVSLEPETMFKFFSVLLASIVLSSAIPIIYISRLDPKQILL